MAEQNHKPLQFLLQLINYSAFMALIWFFSSAPSVYPIGEDEAMITIAFAHAGQLREPCRMLSQEELNELPPNMRKLDECPRERSPVTIEVVLDGNLIYSESLQPPGLFGDGGVDIFYSVKIPAGDHHLILKMNDSVRIEGFNHRFEQAVRVDPARILLVSFQKRKGFVIVDGQN